MNARMVLVLALLPLAGCAAPTLQQRQEAWRQFRTDVTRVCEVGMQVDRAMPEDVMDWCVEVAK